MAPDVEFRHSGWLPLRRRIAHVLAVTDPDSVRLDRFDACGAAAWVLEDPAHPGTYKVASCRCHDRFCVPCRREAARVMAANVATYARDRHLRFMTLTIRHSSRPLPDQLDDLLAHFRTLRATAFWKHLVKGGVAMLEVKRSEDGRFWHPHFHLLYEGQYVLKSALALHWHRITKTSYIVDVRCVKDLTHAAHYITKHIGKPLAPSCAGSPAILETAIVSLHHRRLAFAFGSWRGLRLSARDEPDAWRLIAPLTELLINAQRGIAYAIRIINALRSPHKCHDLMPTTTLPHTRSPPLPLCSASEPLPIAPPAGTLCTR